MKYYSNFTTEYVQDICNALNKAGFTDGNASNKAFAPASFKTLTDFLHFHIIHYANIYEFLNQKGLVNRGKCPYTGQLINSRSPKYSYFGRTIYVSPEGYKIMQREDDESFEEVMGTPAPPRNELSKNKGCSIFLGVAILISACAFLLNII